MTDRYALFMYVPGEAAGGLHDLALVGSLEACVAAAEAHRDKSYVADIADLSTMEIVRSGEWRWEPSPLTGHPPTATYDWHDE